MLSRSSTRIALVGIAMGAVTAAMVAASPGSTAATAGYEQPDGILIDDGFLFERSMDSMTFASGTAGPASIYPSRITVPTTTGLVTDVDVELTNLTHTWPDDLDLMLVGPEGQRVMLLSDAGGNVGITDTYLLLDDEAGGSAADSSSLISFSNIYRPTDYDAAGAADDFPAPAPDASTTGTLLSGFDGTNPSGTWSLYASDDSSGDGGALTGWALSIRTTTPTIATALPYPSTLSVSGAPAGITDVDVLLRGLDHRFISDVDVMLVGPSGQRAVVLSDVAGGGDAVDATLTLDDEAAAAPPETTTDLVTGSYRPMNYGGVDTFPGADATAAGSALSVFDGTNPNGTWRLYVVDDKLGVRGDISGGWALRISTVDPPAAPAITTPTNESVDGDGTIDFSGIAQAGSTVRILEGATERAVATASGSGAWTLALTGVSDGQHVYTATATDGFGNTSTASAPVTVTADTVAPGGSIVINGGAARTNRTLLTLTLSAADPAPGTGATQMRFSNDGTNFSAFEPLAVTKSWTLPTSTNGTRTVWALFADRAGKVSATVANSIILDTVKPRVSKIKPIKGATGVKVGVNVKAFFSEALAAGTMTKANVKLVSAGSTKAIKATISYDAAKRKVTINPKKNLKHGTTYKVTIGTGVKDLAGNNLDQKSKTGNQPMKWKFTTG